MALVWRRLCEGYSHRITIYHELVHVGHIKWIQALCSTTTCRLILSGILLCHRSKSGAACFEKYARHEQAKLLCWKSCDPSLDEEDREELERLANERFKEAMDAEAKCAESTLSCGAFPTPPQKVYGAGGYCPGPEEEAQPPEDPPTDPGGYEPPWGPGVLSECDCAQAQGSGS